MIEQISQPHFMQSISEVERIPFTKEDIYHVIKMHPGVSARNIMPYLGLAVSSHLDRQRINSFLNCIWIYTRKLCDEGRVRIVNRVDRYQYYPILEKNLEAARNE
jgi:hypothetical protein